MLGLKHYPVTAEGIYCFDLVILVHLTNEDGAHREFRNVVGKLVPHIVQKLKNKETVSMVL
jgi:hypothetical protein